MNGDIAHQAATRREDRPGFVDVPAGHKYCWLCSTYKAPDLICFGGRCWDCVHAPTRRAAARVAIDFLNRGQRPGALVALAIALDEQARAEGIFLPPHQTVTRHAHRLLLREAMVSADVMYPVAAYVVTP